MKGHGQREEQVEKWEQEKSDVRIKREAKGKAGKRSPVIPARSITD